MNGRTKDIEAYEKWRTVRLAVIFIFVVAIVAVNFAYSSYYSYASGTSVYSQVSAGIFSVVWGIVGFLLLLLFVIGAVYWFRYGWRGHFFNSRWAEMILMKRYVRGEISYKQYKEMLKRIRE